MTKSLEADRAVRGLMAACTAQRGAGFDATDTLALLNYVRDLERDLGKAVYDKDAMATKVAAERLGLDADGAVASLTKARDGLIARMETVARSEADLLSRVTAGEHRVKNAEHATKKAHGKAEAARVVLQDTQTFLEARGEAQTDRCLTIRAFLDHWTD